MEQIPKAKRRIAFLRLKNTTIFIIWLWLYKMLWFFMSTRHRLPWRRHHSTPPSCSFSVASFNGCNQDGLPLFWAPDGTSQSLLLSPSLSFLLPSVSSISLPPFIFLYSGHFDSRDCCGLSSSRYPYEAVGKVCNIHIPSHHITVDFNVKHFSRHVQPPLCKLQLWCVHSILTLFIVFPRLHFHRFLLLQLL